MMTERKHTMKISSEIASIAPYAGGEARTVALMAEAGFDAYDLSLFSMGRIDWSTGRVKRVGHPLEGEEALAFVREIRRTADACGIVCNQSHAPFPVSCPEIRAMLTRALELTAEAGGKVCVIHPDNHLSAGENAKLFRQLLPTAKSLGVKIATENMWCWDSGEDHATFAACATPADFLAHLDAIDDPDFVACLDIGHAEMRGLGTSAPEMIRALGPRLAALHVHDNDLWHDSHELPFSMQIDFAAVTRALREVGYAGDMTLEADTYFRHHADTAPETLLSRMADTARRLARMVLGEAE